MQTNIFEDKEIDNSIVNIGFWTGGDRDGNPFVTPQITVDVARKLKESIIKNYIKDVKYSQKNEQKLVEDVIFENSFKNTYDILINFKSKYSKLNCLEFTSHHNINTKIIYNYDIIPFI